MIYFQSKQYRLPVLQQMSYKIIILSVVLPIALLQFIDNIPITFQLSGLTTYVPDTGGIAIPGYTLKVGYNYKSWIGIQFMTLTSTNNYDTLIFQRSSTQSGGLYTCTVKDYYISSGRPSVLMKDIQTSVDKVATSSSQSSYFELTVTRTIGNTSGEDWQGGQMTEICFFTSDVAFSETVWSMQYRNCFGYTTMSYISTFKGSYLETMAFEGIESRLYGGIFDTGLQVRLFWFRNSIVISNTSNLIIRVGQSIGELVGYDYYQCGVGDFFGYSESSLQKDLQYHGYDDGKCIYTITGSSIQLDYIRNAITYDEFDFQMAYTSTFCLIGSQSSCKSITLPTLFPIMTVKSALELHQSFILIIGLVILILFLMI